MNTLWIRTLSRSEATLGSRYPLEVERLLLNKLQGPRLPGEDCFTKIDFIRQPGMVSTDNVHREFGHEATLECRARPVYADFMVGGNGKQQKSVVGDEFLAHVGIDDASGFAEGGRQVLDYTGR